MHLYLVRHGESFTNVNHKTLTRPEDHDGSLTPRGEAQAQAAARWLAKKVKNPDLLYASTMKRAMETAGFVSEAIGVDIIPEYRLREMSNNYPDHSPVPADRFALKWRKFSLAKETFGPIAINDAGEALESYAHVKVRVGMWLEEMIAEQQGKTIIAVMHGGILSAFADIILNVGTYRRCDMRPDYTAISHFQHRGDEANHPWSLHFLGMNGHLEGVDEGLGL